MLYLAGYMCTIIMQTGKNRMDVMTNPNVDLITGIDYSGENAYTIDDRTNEEKAMPTVINATTYPNIYAVERLRGDRVPKSYEVAQDDYPTHQINRIEQTLKGSAPEKIAAFIYAASMGVEYRSPKLPDTKENIEVYNYLTGDLY